jgi:proteasome lid subunit RPN8/RPN11
MNSRIKNKIIELAEANPNEEICGLLYYTFDSIEIFPCRNVSLEDKKYSYEIDPQEYIRAVSLGKLCGVYHSHPDDDSLFSETDIEYAEEFALPIYVYGLKDKKFAEYIPSSYEINLEGLPFVWGLFDCFSIVRNYFRQKHKLFISDYDRDESFANSNSNIIIENMNREKFFIVENKDIQNDDVLLFKSNRIFPHHFGVFVGNSRILHHPLGRLSTIELLTEKEIKSLSYVLRMKK